MAVLHLGMDKPRFCLTLKSTLSPYSSLALTPLEGGWAGPGMGPCCAPGNGLQGERVMLSHSSGNSCPGGECGGSAAYLLRPGDNLAIVPSEIK